MEKTRRSDMLKRALEILRLLLTDEWTPEELAIRLNRSERTIWRDLRALREAGIQYHTEGGRCSITPEALIDALTR